MVTVQELAVPGQAPDQPLKVEPAPATAVKVTLLFGVKLAVQMAPQLIPAGELVTVPVPAVVIVSANGVKVKLAPTVCAWVIVTVQGLAVPVQAPDQPLNVEPAVAAAVKVTLAFLVKLALQVAPQLIPAGELVTVPLPVPDLLTVNCTGTDAKPAVTVFAALIVRVQVLAVPVQPPDQPLNVEPAVAAAVKVTLAFWVKLALQVAPQLIPAGELVTVPAPVPDLVTVNNLTGTKPAVTVLAVLMVTVQVLAVPVQAPDQPLKVEPVVAAAVNLTLAFLVKLELQVAPQLMPVGELVTVPLPVPDLLTVSLTVAA
jgi:hypothetical protein